VHCCYYTIFFFAAASALQVFCRSCQAPVKHLLVLYRYLIIASAQALYYESVSDAQVLGRCSADAQAVKLLQSTSRAPAEDLLVLCR
jgi:hypothetical protein